jgi:hypothetical protein
MRIVVVVIALVAAWMMVMGWAAGVNLSRLMTAIGERNAAAEAAALRAKQPPAGDDPGVVYIQRPQDPPPQQKGGR